MQQENASDERRPTRAKLLRLRGQPPNINNKTLLLKGISGRFCLRKHVNGADQLNWWPRLESMSYAT